MIITNCYVCGIELEVNEQTIDMLKNDETLCVLCENCTKMVELLRVNESSMGPKETIH